MVGITIFLHSLRQVTGNIKMAIRVSWWLIAVLLVEAWFVLSGGSSIILGSEFFALLFAVANFIFIIWSFSLIAVVWHRYILLEEIPKGIIPYQQGMNIWPYFWAGVVIALIMLLVGFLVALVLGVFFLAGATSGILIGLVVGFAMTLVFYRIALVLPAVALDKKIRIADAFDATRGFVMPITGLVGAAVAFNFATNYVLNKVFGLQSDTQLAIMTEQGLVFAGGAENAMVYLVISGLLQWFVFMLNISILTTLYGYLVEKRKIF